MALFKSKSGDAKSPADAGSAPVPDAPASLDRALADGAREALRRDRSYARLRQQADKAAAQADRGDDRAYRLLAEAIRRLLNER